MKKMFLYIICVLALVVILIWVFKPLRKLLIERNKEPLPAKYSGFQPIDEHYRSALFSVNLLCSSTVSQAAAPNPIRVFPSINGQLIVSCYTGRQEQSGEDFNYFKLDLKGKVIDSLQLPTDHYWPEFIDGFIVFTDEKNTFYNTWPADGDTTRHQMIGLNTDLSWNQERIRRTIEEARSNSPYYFFKSYSDNGTFIRQFFFLSGKNWQMLCQKITGYTSIDDAESAGRYRKNVFSTGEEDPYLPSGVDLLYFYPQEKMDYAHVIGGGQGGFSKYDWRGTGFFSTIISGRKMDFCVPKLVVEKEKFDNFQTRLYIVDKPESAVRQFKPAFYIDPGGFALYSPNAKVLYLIRTIQNK